MCSSDLSHTSTPHTPSHTSTPRSSAAQTLHGYVTGGCYVLALIAAAFIVSYLVTASLTGAASLAYIVFDSAFFALSATVLAGTLSLVTSLAVPALCIIAVSFAVLLYTRFVLFIYNTYSLTTQER